MNWAKFGVDQMNTLGAKKGQKRGFPIERRPGSYNIIEGLSLALARDNPSKITIFRVSNIMSLL